VAFRQLFPQGGRADGYGFVRVERGARKLILKARESTSLEGMNGRASRWIFRYFGVRPGQTVDMFAHTRVVRTCDSIELACQGGQLERKSLKLMARQVGLLNSNSTVALPSGRVLQIASCRPRVGLVRRRTAIRFTSGADSSEDDAETTDEEN
jgi:hypothetical protein